MKKLIGIVVSCFILFSTEAAFSQDKSDSTTIGQDLKKAGKATGNAAKKAGKKVAATGAKGAAKVKDKSLDNVKGPNGETVYIDENQRKYYVNKDARRVYLAD